jgi:DNA-binding MarR family transcriptional regulator
VRKASQKAEQTADLLHGTAIRLLRFVRKEDAAAGITGPQLSVLSVLVYAGPQTLGKLAAAEQVRPPTMSQMVSELEKRGLAVRRPIDRRSILVSVTEKGKKLLEAGRKRRLAKLSAALSDLPAEKLELLREASDLVIGVTEFTI